MKMYCDIGTSLLNSTESNSVCMYMTLSMKDDVQYRYVHIYY